MDEYGEEYDEYGEECYKSRDEFHVKYKEENHGKVILKTRSRKWRDNLSKTDNIEIRSVEHTSLRLFQQ